MKLPVLFASTVLFCVSSHAQVAKKPDYQVQISVMLKNASARLPVDEKADGARLYLSRAMAMNSDYASAKALIGVVKAPSRRADGWAYLGRAQGKVGRDKTGAKASFDAAIEAAKNIKTGEYDRNSKLQSIARDQAESGDVESALRLAQTITGFQKFSALEGVARPAARAGDFKPAESLLEIARTDEEISQANMLICIGHANAANWVPARAALAKITRPQDKVPALLALYDSQDARARQTDRYLPQALALVPQIANDEDEIDFSGTIRDADLGRIAYLQLDHPDEKTAVANATKTLMLIEKETNAQRPIEIVCGILADDHLPEALAIANEFTGSVRIAAFCSIMDTVSSKWLDADEDEKPALIKAVSDAAHAATEVLDTMEDSDRNWAIATIAKSSARARDYDAATKFAQKIDTPRRRAYAFGGIALAAIEQENASRAKSNLAALEAAARKAVDPTESAEILAQSVLGILEPLLDDEPVGFAEAMAGLN